MINEASRIFEKGIALLNPLLAAHGFIFKDSGKGNSSGGPFACGEFKKDGRWLELHFRNSLGLVSYHLDVRAMSHQDYMRSVNGNPNSSHYPGFSDDPLDGFRHLLLDLQEHGADFLSGTDQCLMHRIDHANNLPPLKKGLPD
jgi:hypothetical protein